MAKTINARMLKRHGACTPQYKLFLKYYGSTRSVEVTEEEAMKHAHDFDWLWAAMEFLNNDQYRLYNEAMEEALKLYNEAIAEPQKLYKVAIAEPQKVYNEAQVRAFVNAYNS